jgi:hypothetical protein
MINFTTFNNVARVTVSGDGVLIVFGRNDEGKYQPDAFYGHNENTKYPIHIEYKGHVTMMCLGDSINIYPAGGTVLIDLENFII